MNGRMIDIGKNNINYTKLLNPIYIESIQARRSDMLFTREYI